jgi:menaquinone-dependent protoporphyrinogen IX oxidase
MRMKIWIIYDSKFGNNKLVAETLETTLKVDNDVSVAYAKKVSPKLVLKDAPDALLFGGPLRAGMISFTIKGWATKFAKLLKKKNVRLQKVAAWGTHGPITPQTPPKFAWTNIEPKWKALRDLVPAEKTLQEFPDFVVGGMKGPLEEGWQERAVQFAGQFNSL